MSHPARTPGHAVGEESEHRRCDVISAYRDLASHVVVTVVLLMLLAAVAYWSLLT